MRKSLVPIAWLVVAAAADGQSLDAAKWIWGHWSADSFTRPPGEVCILRRDVSLAAAPKRALAIASADNHFKLFVNGQLVGRGDSWERVTKLDLAPALHAGSNRLEAECLNDDSPAGFLFAAELQTADGATMTLVSDASWLSARARDGNFEPARELGGYGMPPWGRIAAPTPGCLPDPLPGFHVQTVVEGIGSIDAFTQLGPGRLVASIEGSPLLELTDSDGDGAIDATAVFDDQVHASQGMLWHGGSLFTTGDGPAGHGLYRLDRGEPAKLYVRFDGDIGEHGPHAIVPGPDGWLYVMVGNHAKLAVPPSPASPYRTTYEGHLLPPYLDPRGHAVQCQAPGGFVLRVEPTTREYQLFCAGFRNAYDLAFDAGGRLFTFDSDMEWDIGLPWYRPVRLLHLIAGGEYGWRTGSKCWPEVYADSLPTALDVGRGSPTGMCLCTGDRFPSRFRGALLAGDWSQGRIFAFQPVARGASFTATCDVLLSGHPLNVTDLEMVDDGSLLFSVGGRGTQGGIYRLVYDGPVEKTLVATPPSRMPAFDSKSDLSTLLEALGTDDRFVRFVAGRELERRDPATWEERALKQSSALVRGEALIALARPPLALPIPIADPGDSKPRAPAPPGTPPPPPRTDPARLSARLDAALAILVADAKGVERLTALRALELLLLDPALQSCAAPLDGAPLLSKFPCGDRAADRELSLLIARLDPPGAAAKLWRAFQDEPSREQRISYAYALRAVAGSWPEGVREQLHDWLDRGIGSWSGGMSFEGYLRHLREDVDAGFSPQQREQLAKAADAARAARAESAAESASEPRDLDRTLLCVEPTLHSPRRSLADGALVFQKLCSKCHQRFEAGQAVGPDLTTIGARFGLRDLLESMIAPSRTISDQYRGLVAVRKDGDVLSGMPVVDDGKTLVLVESSGEKVEIPASEIASRRPATKSVMPDGVLDSLTLEEIADLCAWLLGDKPVAPASAPGWRPLFDGKTLGGFEGDLARWRVEGDSIVGHGEGLTAPTDLIATGTLGDFVLEAELRIGAASTDSGLKFRARRAGPASLVGYEADAGERRWGSIIEEGGRGRLAQVKDEIWQTMADPTGWNHVVVVAAGPRISLELNGLVTVDLLDVDGPREGLLGIELRPGTEVRVRNLRVRPLPPSLASPPPPSR